jgi:hypothetical protein
LEIPVIGIVVISRRQRVGLAHLDLRLNRLKDSGDYVSRAFEKRG